MSESLAYGGRPIRGGAGAGGAPYDPDRPSMPSLKQQAIGYRDSSTDLRATGFPRLARLFDQMANAIDPSHI